MSYILDALKRAEHERSGALATAPGREAAPQGLARISALWLILIGVLLFGAGIAISWLLLRPSAPTAAVPTATVLSAVVPSTAAPVAQAVPTSAPALAEPEPAMTAESSAADTELLGDAAQIEPALAGYESLDDLTPVFQGSGAGASSATPAAKTSTTISGNPGEASSTPSAGTAAPVHLEPLLRDMPQAYRDQFPNLTIQVHVHNAAPEKRWIMLDSKRYGEGAQLDSGPQIVEIAADGIVFSFRNERVFWPLGR